MKKILCFILAMLLLTGCSADEEVQSLAATEPVTEATTAPTTQPTEPPEVRYVFTFAGDCTFGSLPQHVTAGYAFPMTVGEDYDYPFRNIVEYFRNDDFSMVNLEGVLGDQGVRAGKRYNFQGDAACLWSGNI